jgi:hypothetical protein
LDLRNKIRMTDFESRTPNKSIPCKRCGLRLCWDEKDSRVRVYAGRGGKYDDGKRYGGCASCCAAGNPTEGYFYTDCCGATRIQGLSHTDDGELVKHLRAPCIADTPIHERGQVTHPQKEELVGHRSDKLSTCLLIQKVLRKMIKFGTN